jgi:hypothetical protein
MSVVEFYGLMSVLSFIIVSSFIVSCQDAVIRADRMILVSWSEYRENVTTGHLIIAIVVSLIPFLNALFVLMGTVFFVIDFVRAAFALEILNKRPLAKRERFKPESK